MLLGHKHVSYIKRHFFYLFLMVAILVCAMGGVIVGVSRDLVGNEIVKLHQALLKQSADTTADTLGAMKESLEEIAQNAGVTQWLASLQTAKDEIESSDVDSLIQDQIYKNYKRGSIFRVYIYDLEGLRYSSDRLSIPWEEITEWISENTLVGENILEGILIKGPVWKEEEGLYRHSIYLLRAVEDLLTGQVEGYVLMQFSEKVLYDTYSSLRGKDRDYGIIDKNGILVSGANKSEIGTVKIEFTENGKSSQEYMCFYEPILGTDWYLVERINVHEIWNTLDRVAWLILGFLGGFVLCLFPLTVFSRKSILRPVYKIKDKMSQVAEGNLSIRLDEKERGQGEFAEIADSFNHMVDQLEHQMEDIREIEHKKHLLELDFLQAQINPHFIYNTLSSIRFYVEMGKNEEAEDMLIDFSKILRKTLSRTEKMVTLREEIETLKHYVNLQKARYRERFQVEFDMEESALSALLPDFILQPIVENAIFYSLKEGEVSHIQITSRLEGRNLLICVKDDGVGMNQDKIDQALNKELSMNKVGLKNVNERLKLNFGENYGIRIQSREHIGTEVILVIPATAEGKRQT